ncbi:PREDICTED: coumaroyl-CoA:anthocyanidin 3-O-glucoside-6''-O-coumaroyltransferase 1 [Theobroma cacao]|uniref:Coumaroyl-CoA:anthocyanidin 3-O-glucoside-6''-O-coumaroyltransferase 1 n=1 Tax=Theobroma cacao TaxID=3641 RepID=A0AB32VID8_THECC|nr:PREDICTED: coumaroyl-CoA:anthocyanidin 3-O-glucoside-6''-O-coumaroyltransferase 1 [Theobroma cacao]
MAQTGTIKVLDSSHVSPPPSSVPTTSLPLTHFDLPWFPCYIERLFFYKFSHPTLHFMETTLPMLKCSLSLTLQHFFPYAANIMCPQPPGKPYIHYIDGDFVTFTVAESAADFNHVKANYPRDIKLLRPFVPQLPPARVAEDGIRVCPITAFQVTVFPNSGICIGSTYWHVVGDGKSFMHFMRSWTAVCRSGGDLTCLENSLPLINKDVIKDPGGIELVRLKNYWHWVSFSNENSGPTHAIAEDKVRATFVLGRAHAERLKHLVTGQCRDGVESEQLHISTFVVTCAFIWVCLIKSKDSATNNLSRDDDDKFYFLLFPFDCRNRLEFPVPPTYFGNCLRPGVVDVTKSELIGENGILLASKVIGNKIKEMERSGLRGAEHWISSLVERMKSRRLTAVAGSPKFHVYDTDFGWGRPCKVELTHIDYDGAISLAECKDEPGGIEVGLALNKNQMDEFITIFEQSLKLL